MRMRGMFSDCVCRICSVQPYGENRFPDGFFASVVSTSQLNFQQNLKGGNHSVPTIVWILIVLLVGAGGGFAGYTYRQKMVEEKINRSEETAKRLYEDAVRKADDYKRKADDYKKEKVQEAKAEILKAKDEIDREKADNNREMNEIRERRAEVQRSENRLVQREASLDKRSDSLDDRENDLKKRSDLMERKQEDTARLHDEAEALVTKQNTELERIASMTQDEAKQIIIDRVQKEAFHDAAASVRDIEARAKEEAEKKARNIIALAIQKCASDHVAESTVSVIALPNDDMKGRIIGREGRNIRTIETLTGVDLIIDDTPEAITVSCFEPVRREVARLALEKLIADGRIHPTHIEEMVNKARREVDAIIKSEGERAVLETGIRGLHPELVKMLGRLHYRTSYGQNVLQHSIEVSHLAGMMAAELGADVYAAKRAGLLHDIGKAVDHEMEGTHVALGVEFLRKYHEKDDIIHAVQAHHNDVEPQTIVACLVQAADAISAARPGARRENLENYIKRLEQLEEITGSYPGVDKAYAIQAGREVRVMVKPDQVSEDQMIILARELAKKIEEEMEYPGQIKVHVLRETTAIEYAK